MLTTTRDVLEKTIQQAVDLAKSANTAFRSHDDVAVALPGGLFGHVRNGKLVGFGLEPVGDVYVDSERQVSDLPDGAKGHLMWNRVAAVAGAAVSTAAGVATAILLGRRRSDG
jgi:hypothetical protein